MRAFISIDNSIFFFINHLPHPDWMDKLFVLFSYNPIVVWVVIGITILIFEKGIKKHFILDLIGSLFLAGFIASVLLKPIFSRPRPDISHGNNVIIVEEKKASISWNNDFAFPSGHASVAFAGAYILSKRKKKWWPGFYAIAFLTAFSRIYLGKHYFFDVVAGGILGAFVGYFVTRFFGVKVFNKKS